MENASKALIIAGAILLSILLISLGILIYSQAAGVANSTNMDSQSIDTYNNQFTQYEGERVKGSVVKTLINRVISSNSRPENQDIKIELDDVANTADVNANKYYSVRCTINTNDSSVDPKGGRVETITITQVST